jgi:hypothetical protein
MSTQNQSNLSVEEAQKILKDFSCIDVKSVDSESEKALIRQALLLLTSLSDYQNFGICADTAAQGFLALETYLKALGYEATLDQADITSFVGPVYIKFNTQRRSSYLDSYIGKYRGVLVSCQSSQEESINGTYGHLPLDLFV